MHRSMSGKPAYLYPYYLILEEDLINHLNTFKCYNRLTKDILCNA